MKMKVTVYINQTHLFTNFMKASAWRAQAKLIDKNPWFQVQEENTAKKNALQKTRDFQPIFVVFASN